MELKKITKNCYYLTHREFGHRPALGYILSPFGDAFMVDAGNSPAHMKEFLEIIAANNLPVPKLCLVTQAKWNHTFGMQYFADKAKTGMYGADLKERAEMLFVTEYEEYRKYNNGYCGFYEEFCASTGAPMSFEKFEEYDDMKDEYNGDLSSIRYTFNGLEPDSSTINKLFLSPSTGVKILQVPTPYSQTGCIVLAANDKVVFGGECIYLDLVKCKTFNLKRKKNIFIRLEELREYLEMLDFEIFVPSYGNVLTKEETLMFIADELSELGKLDEMDETDESYEWDAMEDWEGWKSYRVS